MNIRFSADEFLKLGMYLGSTWNNVQIDAFSKKRWQTFFKDSFYASAQTVKELFRDIQHPDLGEHSIKKPNPVHLLGALHFLKKYPTKFDQAKYIGCSERNSLGISWRYVYSIRALKEKKIKWIFDEEPYIEDNDYYL